MKAVKPIRVFFSPLSRRFYASRAYRVEKDGKLITVTGEKFDITDEIATLIEEYDVKFAKRSVENA